MSLAAGIGARELTEYDSNVEDEDDDEDSNPSLPLHEDRGILRDYIRSQNDGGFDPAENPLALSDPERCTPQECILLREKLRTLQPSRFVMDYLTSGDFTAKKLCSAFIELPEFLTEYVRDDEQYYEFLGLVLVHEFATRRKLLQYNTFDDAVELLKRSTKIMVITGAGISTSLGIPDFRSEKTGFYATLKTKFDDPMIVFDLDHFRENPNDFYEHAGATLPEDQKSTPTHAFIRLLQDKEKLLTNYTQNIDNIEGNVGIDADHLIQAHGSWAGFRCMKCSHHLAGTKDLYDNVRTKTVPTCPKCVEELAKQSSKRKRKRSSKGSGGSKTRRKDYDENSDDDAIYDLPEPGILKPDITFFQEALPSVFFDRFRQRDQAQVDLLIVIGTSMKVAPVSEMPLAIPREVPQIFISRDPVKHLRFDITLLGECDVIVNQLCQKAGWQLQHPMISSDEVVEMSQRAGQPATWEISRA